MWNSWSRSDDAGRHRLATAEDFSTNPTWRDANTCKRVFHLRHESSRPAQVDIGLRRDTEFFENGSRQTTGSVEVPTALVARVGAAVTDIAPAVSEPAQQTAHFCTERMMRSIASCMQPQNLPCRVRGCERMQHRDNRGRPDPCTQEHHRPVAPYRHVQGCVVVKSCGDHAKHYTL